MQKLCCFGGSPNVLPDYVQTHLRLFMGKEQTVKFQQQHWWGASSRSTSLLSDTAIRVIVLIKRLVSLGPFAGHTCWGWKKLAERKFSRANVWEKRHWVVQQRKLMSSLGNVLVFSFSIIWSSDFNQETSVFLKLLCHNLPDSIDSINAESKIW